MKNMCDSVNTEIRVGMSTCAIINCKNRGVKGGVISFLSFPKEESTANEWLKYCKPKTNVRNGMYSRLQIDLLLFKRYTGNKNCR